MPTWSSRSLFMLHPSVCLTLHFTSFLPASAPRGTLMIVKTWSAPIRQEITPCYIPLMCQLPAEAWLSVCWNTERDGAVGLHPNQPTHSCSFPLYSGHSSPYTASINPCLLMAIILFCTPFTITYSGTLQSALFSYNSMVGSVLLRLYYSDLPTIANVWFINEWQSHILMVYS